MAFTVEDGSGIAGANAYITVSFFRDYHGDRGRTVDSGTYSDSVVQAAIIQASDYLEQRFGNRYKGFRQSKGQGLGWPRYDAFDVDGFVLNLVPTKLQRACAEYTYITLRLSEDLLAVPARSGSSVNLSTGSVTTGNGTVIEKEEKVGPIEERVKYSDPADSAGDPTTATKSFLVSDVNIPDYPQADLWVADLIKSGNTFRMSRGD